MTEVLRENTSKLVEYTAESSGLSEELRNRTHRYLAAAAVIFLCPFSINNFYQGRYYLGVFSLFIVLLSFFNNKRLGRMTCIPRNFPRLMVLSIIVYIYFCFDLQGALAVFWCFPTVVVFYFILPQAQARLVNILALALFVPQVWRFLEPEMATRATVTLVLVSLFSAIFIFLLEQQQVRLRELAVKDPLTGVLNRLLLDTFLERAALVAGRGERQVSLIYLDLDHFKLINDKLGHEAGDIVLKKLGNLLLNRVRRSDAVFRLGGEEFLLLLLDTDKEDAIEVAKQLRILIRETEMLPAQRVTASLGVSTLAPDESWRSWLKRGDLAVYSAKRMGRDRVAIAPVDCKV